MVGKRNHRRGIYILRTRCGKWLVCPPINPPGRVRPSGDHHTRRAFRFIGNHGRIRVPRQPL